MAAVSHKCLLGFIILCSLLTGSLAQWVKVEPEVVSYPGQTVTLRCQLTNPRNFRFTQVSWILEPTNGERTNIAVFHPQFGINYPTKSPVAGRVGFVLNPPTLDNPSIQIKDLKMTDEGRYICEYATYPSGNEQGVSSLIMLVKPRNMATTFTVTAGNTPVVVASCESSNGRPAATISWSTTLNGNATTLQMTNNPDNTVTVQSQYMLAPQPVDNGKDITCMVSHRTMPQPETFPMKLIVKHQAVTTANPQTTSTRNASETEDHKTFLNSLYRVIIVIVEIIAFAAPTVILLQIICKERSEKRRRTQTTRNTI
ncbi:nectin-2-like isoform X2 [Paramisgurnus dabryanus]|uniref:nectin-2-like isoform X2 n=1 Tax=Paramisgurnus dabryanus TaxID=90735 RepID=UPI0031F4715E